MWMCLFFRYYACLCGHEELVQYLLASGKVDIWLYFAELYHKHNKALKAAVLLVLE